MPREIARVIGSNCGRIAGPNEASAKGRDGVQKRTGEIKGARAKPKSLNRATYSALRHCPLQPSRVLLFTLFVAPRRVISGNV